jgi:hypothetical protein
MKLTDLKAIYMCPAHNDKYRNRKIHMDNLLTTIGFKDFTHFLSTTEKYPTCLNKATINILESNLDTPILILEDDVEWTGIQEFVFDPDADAIYLGLSKSGGHPSENIHLGESVFETWSDSQARVINMLSGHAILYISRKYKEAVIKILKDNVNTYYNDVLFSRLQPKFTILANKIPAFYQSSKFNNGTHEEMWTNIVLNI